MQGRRQLPVGIDKNILNEDEINQLLKITSEKSLAKIARETEALAGHSNLLKCQDGQVRHES